jgi:glycosyltransferase involved in cell wall biosynthesis
MQNSEENLCANIDKKIIGDRIMLFDLSVRGHHPIYIRHLLQYWSKYKLPGSLHIVVSPQFMQVHEDVIVLADQDPQQNVHFVAISPQEETALNSRKTWFNRAMRSFQEWKLFCCYAKQLEASAALLMYFDTFQKPIALGMKSPCPFSGLYFRPTFHYDEFAIAPPSLKMRIQHWWERVLIAQVLKHPDWQTLYSLDPLALKGLEQFHSGAKVVHLPDPIEIYEVDRSQVATMREQLGIEPGRLIFLLFGALTTRKGVDQVLDAVSQLPLDSCKQICLLMVGESNLQEKLEARMAHICRSQPIQFVRHYEFVPDSAVPAYFQLADVVLATYQRHVGSSGILLWAAAAQTPVLSSDFGLMGEQVRRYELGIAVDSTIPTEIAKGFMHFLSEPIESIGDRTQMKIFAQQNSVEQYARAIFQYVL